MYKIIFIYILILILNIINAIPLTSSIWVTSNPAPGQSPGPPGKFNSSLCTGEKYTGDFIGESDSVNISVVNKLFNTNSGLVAGITYEVVVTLQEITDSPSWLTISSDLPNGRFQPISWDSTWTLCASDAAILVLLQPNVRSLTVAWSFPLLSASTNVAFRVQQYSHTSSTILSQGIHTSLLLSGCSLHLENENDNVTWSSLEASAALFQDCTLQIPKPNTRRGLLVTLSRLNIAGNPSICLDGYLQFGIHKLCGKLEEQPNKEIYWPENNGLKVEIHFPLQSPMPMYYSFNYKSVDACYNLTLNSQNSTFITDVSKELSCSVLIHVAYGYRVALSIELRAKVQNGIEDGDNIWDELLPDEYIEEDPCIGLLIHITGDNGEYWSQCASNPGHVIRALGQTNILSIRVTSNLALYNSILYISYMTIPIPELTDDCLDYGWVSISESICALPVMDKQVTWSFAGKECVKQGGSLFSVTSQELQTALDTTLIKSPGYKDDSAFWIGAEDREREGDFRWSDGKTFSYTNWFPGWPQFSLYNRQPSDDGLSDQDCVEMRRSFLVPSPSQPPPGGGLSPASLSTTARLTPHFMWNDRDCSARNYYVCQIIKTSASRISETSPTIPQQMDCSRNVTLGRELGRSSSATITSPGFPQSYPDNARCITRVKAPAGYHVVIDFEELVLEKEPLCSYDYLEISEPDAEVPARRLCHDWSGKLKLLRHVSKGSELQLLFSSDYSHRFGGFKARVFMENDELECADSREINFNGSCYLFIGFPEVTWATSRQVCRGMNAELASVHSLQEQNFLISAIRNSEQYSASTIYWLGGELKSGQLSWTDTSQTSFVGWPVREKVEAIEPRCLAIGWTPSPSPALSSGLYWQAQRCSLVGGYVCQRRIQEPASSLRTNRTVEGTSGTLTSPNYPTVYPANADYWVRVEGPVGTRLVLEFTSMDVESQTECLYDFVALWDEAGVEPATTICSLHTSDLDSLRFVSASNIFLLHFHSDFSTSGTGFASTWRAVALLGCPQQTLTAREGVVTSPNYPHFLLGALDCSTTILAPAGRRVWLQFEDYEVDPNWSSLELHLGSGPAFTPYQVENLVSEGTYLSAGESLRIHLRTSMEIGVPTRGFKAVYWTLSNLEETQVIQLQENVTSQLLPLNWPATAPHIEHLGTFTQRLVAPLGHVISLTLHGVRVSTNEVTDECLEVQDFYSDVNGSFWLLCKNRDNLETPPVTLTSYINSLQIKQTGGDVLNATISLTLDEGYKQKLLSRELGTGIDSCTPDPCINGGHCIPASGSSSVLSRPHSCQCVGHFTGLFCALTWCDETPCMFGSCNLTSTGFHCKCNPGYRGTNCEARHNPCDDNPCEGRGECLERPGGDGYTCRCHAWWEGNRCERRMIRIPFKPLSERMLQEPFWLGLITVMVVLCCIGVVWCAKRHFPEKLEKLLAEEADRSKTSYASSVSRDPSCGAMAGAASPVGAPRSSILGRLGIRKPSLLSLTPSSPKDGQAPRTFSLDDLLRRTPSPRKKRNNSTPTRKPMDKKHILQQLVTPSGGSGGASTSTGRKVSLGELIQLSEKNRRTNSEEGPVPSEAETSLDLDPKLEKKVTFARLLDRVSAEMSSGSGGSGSPPSQPAHVHGRDSLPNSSEEATTLSGSDPALPLGNRRLLANSRTRLSRMSSADSILAMFRTTFNPKTSPSTPSSPQDISDQDSSAVPTPASSSAPDSPMSLHQSTIEVPVISSGGQSSSLLHPPTILLEIPNIEYGKCLSPIKEVPTPCPSPAPTPLLMPRRNTSKEKLEEDEAMRIEVLHPAAAANSTPSVSLNTPVSSPQSEDFSPTRPKARPPTSLQIPIICLPSDDELSPKAPQNIVIPILTVQTPSPPSIPAGSPPPRRNSKLGKAPNKRLLRDFMNEKTNSLDFPSSPPIITVTGTLSEAESDADSPAVKVSVNSGMTYLSPFSMCAQTQRTASESNLSSSGYSSMASPGPSRCGSSNPLCPSEPEEILTPATSNPPIPPPRKPSPLIRSPAIQEPLQNHIDSNDEGFGTDHLEDLNMKLQLPSIVVQSAEGAHLSPVSSRSESPLSDKTCGLDRFSPLFYSKPEMPFTDSDGLYDCPSSEVIAVPQTRKAAGSKRRERRRSTANAVPRGSSLGGLLEVPSKDVTSHQNNTHRCSARKPSPKRRAARIAPPSSSSSSESLSSFRGNRTPRQESSSPSKQSSRLNSPIKSPSKSSPSRPTSSNSNHQMATVNGDDSGELLHQEVLAEGSDLSSGKTCRYPSPANAIRVSRKISRMKAIGNQIRFLRRLEMSLRRREQQSPSDSLDTDLSSPTSSPTLPNGPSLLRFKARALTRRQMPGRVQSRCELATFLLGAAAAPAQQDSD